MIEVLLLFIAVMCGMAAITPCGVTRRERARDARGRFLPDDPATPNINEAWRQH